MYETDREIRAKSIEIAVNAQAIVMAGALANPNLKNLIAGEETYELADRIFDYISDGKKHPEGVIGVK
jgi:hypothetical protein